MMIDELRRERIANLKKLKKIGWSRYNHEYKKIVCIGVAWATDMFVLQYKMKGHGLITDIYFPETRIYSSEDLQHIEKVIDLYKDVYQIHQSDLLKIKTPQSDEGLVKA